ncbi:MAG: hypothetical protein AB2812_05480 [Candidatus Sedimenticola endophacoides]
MRDEQRVTPGAIERPSRGGLETRGKRPLTAMESEAKAVSPR